MGAGSFRVDERRHGQLVPGGEGGAVSRAQKSHGQFANVYSDAVASLFIARARRRSVNQIAIRVIS